MATIRPRQRRDGSIAYLAEIRIKRDGRLVHRESRTIDRRRLATEWTTRRESKLRKADALPKRNQLTPRRPLQKILLKYRKEVSDIRPMGRSNSAHIKFLEKTNLASIEVADLKSSDVIEHVRARRRSGAGASAVNNDLVWLRTILRYARAAWNLPVDLAAIDDNVQETQTGIVRNLKHPTDRELFRRFKYSDEAWEIVDRQDHGDSRVFPFEPKTIGAAFTRACRVLEIDNLHFHDLRHEATSRLFEAGYSIVEVQQFTLHESWGTLSRYTHLRPEFVKIRTGKSKVDRSHAVESPRSPAQILSEVATGSPR
jgi:integrase